MATPTSQVPASPGPEPTPAIRRAIELEILPRLMMAHRVGPLSPNQISTALRTLGADDVDEFVRYVRGSGETQALRYVESLVDAGVAVESVYLDLLAPAARRLGEFWETDTCDFVEVTIAVGRLQRILRGLSQMTLVEDSERAPVGRVLLTCPAGEQHTLGVFMLTEFFVKAGWTVDVGAPLTVSGLGEVLHEAHYDVLGFSLGCENRLSQVSKEIRGARRASRNGALRVLVGGAIISAHPELVRSLGADGGAVDAREAPALARNMLPARSA